MIGPADIAGLPLGPLNGITNPDRLDPSTRADSNQDWFGITTEIQAGAAGTHSLSSANVREHVSEILSHLRATD